MTTNGVTMKKIQILAASILLMSAALSFSGANAEEKSNGGENKGNSSNQSQEFKGSGTRSHGHPLYNLSDAPTAGSVQDKSSFVKNDDEASELEWQKWNKVNSKATAKALNSLASNPIIYHAGGSLNVYSGSVQIIPVWVGNWDANRKATWNTILGTLVSSLGSNSIAMPKHIFNTNLGYFSNNAPTLSWPNSLSATIPATGSIKSGLIQVSDANVATYINSAISKNVISKGVKPIYVYIGASNTRLSSGFGTAYCGWHSLGSIGNASVPYIAVQDIPDLYSRGCAAQTISPNGDYKLDAVASILVHEIDESLTDPDLATWYDARGAENADKCAWAFGTSYILNGAKWNYQAPGTSTKYYIQMNWLADNKVTDPVTGSACVVTK